MYRVNKVKFFQILKLWQVGRILYRCGKDMAAKYGLQHWNGSWAKTAVIVVLCILKNRIYLVENRDCAGVATFQVQKKQSQLHFAKLATDPDFAGKGVGSFCIDRIEQIAVEEACKEVFCEVYDKSEHAIAFYKKRGYVVCGKVNSIKYTQLQMKKTVGENE